MPITTLEEYSKVVLSLADICKREKIANGKKYKSLHTWYLYRQSFYGFVEFFDWEKICKVSEKAKEAYKKIDSNEDLHTKKWDDQLKFDKDRQHGIFHLEHVYTGDMFRKAVESLSDNERTIENIVKIVKENYCVAWILKNENKLLPQSDRGDTLKDALDIYLKCNIKLI